MCKTLADQQEKFFLGGNLEDLQYIYWSITTESSTLALHQDFPAEFQATMKQTQDKIQPATYLSNTLNTVFNTKKQLEWPEARWCKDQCADSGSRGSGSCSCVCRLLDLLVVSIQSCFNTSCFDTSLFIRGVNSSTYLA